jgi:hypothetical protein
MNRKHWTKTTLIVIMGLLFIFDTPVVYADNCGSLSDCFFTLAIALAVIAAIAIIVAGIIALPALLASLGGLLGGGGLALAGGGVLGGTAVVVPAAAVTAANIAAAAAAAAAASAAAGNILMMSSSGTPGSNQAQNRQFRGAVQEAQRKLGRRLSKDEIRRVHDEISKQGYGYKEIVELILDMFGG